MGTGFATRPSFDFVIPPAQIVTSMANDGVSDDFNARIKRGDIDAFHTLYTESFNRLRIYAQQFVYDYQEAEDIVQDSFYALWSNLRFYNPKYNIHNYLMQIVKNNCYNYLHSLKIHDEHRDKIVEALIFSGMSDGSPDDDVSLRLRRALAELPERGRAILLEHVLHGKKIKVIAEEMNVAELTVKTHLKRVMQILRSRLCFILFGL